MLLVQQKAAGQNPETFREKTFADINKRIYVAGESIRYKAYILNASTLDNSCCSQFLYFDLLNQSNEQVLTWKSSSISSVCSGAAILPDSLSTGLYRFRVYSNWMLNWSDEYFFTLPIMIVQLNEQNEKIESKTMKSRKEERLINIPKSGLINIFGSKINFSVKHQKPDLILKLAVDTNITESYKECFLNVSMFGQLAYSEEIQFTDDIAEIKIPLKELKSGSMLIRVISKSNEILGSAFFYHDTFLPKPEIVLDRAGYGRNEKVHLKLSLPELSIKETANASLSVTMPHVFEEQIDNNKMDEFLLFQSEFPNTQNMHSVESKDHITLRNYYWTEEKRSNKTNCFLKETKGAIISGKLTDIVNGVVLPGENVFLSKFDSTVSYQHTISDLNGIFHFLTDTDYYNKRLIIQASSNSNQGIKIDIGNNFEFQNDKSGSSEIWELDIKQEQYLENMRQSAIVSKIFLNSDEKYEDDRVNWKSNFFIPNYVVIPSDFEDLPDFHEIANNLLPGVRFRNRKGRPKLDIYIADIELPDSFQSGLFVNGVPFENLEYLSSLSTTDIKKIEVCNQLCMHGNRTYAGILSIYTYDLTIQPSSFNNSFVFYENSISAPKLDEVYCREDYEIPWLDPCLYWNSNIELKGDSSIDIEFLTSSIAGSYIIHINGITNSGRPFSGQVELKVGKDE